MLFQTRISVSKYYRSNRARRILDCSPSSTCNSSPFQAARRHPALAFESPFLKCKKLRVTRRTFQLAKIHFEPRASHDEIIRSQFDNQSATPRLFGIVFSCEFAGAAAYCRKKCWE